MNNLTKNILSSCMILLTFICVIICIVITLISSSNSYYRVIYKLEPEIIEGTAVCIGDTYNNKKSSENNLFYELNISLNNDTNIIMEKFSTDFNYEINSDGYVESVYYDGIMYYSDIYLIPPGTTGKVKAIVEIPKYASEITVLDWDDKGTKAVIDLKP